MLKSALLAGCALAATTAGATPTASPLPTLSIAFPKAGNRAETIRLYGGYLAHVSQCARVSFVSLRGERLDKVVNGLDLLGEDDLARHLKDGRLDIAQLSSGIVPIAVASASVVPFAVRGNSTTGQIGAYRLRLMVRADSPYRKPAELKGRKIAHTTPASNSGNLAPRAYFPGLGLVPEKDYEVVYSKGHERSLVGLQHGFWAAAAVASDQFDRMVAKGEIEATTFRSLWESAEFPASAFVFGAQVPQAVQQRIAACTYQYRFPKPLQALLDGSDTFLPVAYEKHYAPVLYVLQQSKGTAPGAATK